MLKSLTFLLIFSCHLSQSFAVSVNYLVEGDLQLAKGSDLYFLDGAHFQWTISADTESSPVDIRTAYRSGLDGFDLGTISSYQSTNSIISFTNRVNTNTDITVTSTPPLIQTANYSASGISTDAFEIHASYLNADFSELFISMFGFSGPPDFYLENGVASLPSQFFFNNATAYWGIIGSNDDTIRYNTTNFTMSVTTVPVPAAIWLFGSGLIGLIGLGRRKQK